MRPFLLLTCTLLCIATAPAARAADEAEGTRARFAAERSAIETRFRQAEVACRDKFAVNQCLEQARSERRKALAGVREAELALDDRQRQQRAAERRSAVQQKQAELQARVASAAAAGSAPASPPVEVRPPRGAASAAQRPGRTPIDGGAEAAAARASAAAARAKEFEARQARIVERERERAAASRPAPAPLPLPAPASAPR